MHLDSPKASLLHELPSEPFLVIRAAGSLGAIDLVLARGSTCLLIEVKATQQTTLKGGATVRLSDSNGDGLEQRDLIHALEDRFALDVDVFHRGFAVRRKGRRPEGVPRWTWHPIEDLAGETVLRAQDGTPLLPFLSRLTVQDGVEE